MISPGCVYCVWSVWVRSCPPRQRFTISSCGIIAAHRLPTSTARLSRMASEYCKTNAERLVLYVSSPCIDTTETFYDPGAGQHGDATTGLHFFLDQLKKQSETSNLDGGLFDRSSFQ